MGWIKAENILHEENTQKTQTDKKKVGDLNFLAYHYPKWDTSNLFQWTSMLHPK